MSVAPFLKNRPLHYSSSVYSKAPVILYVGAHAFKVPADYSFLSEADYGGPGNSELIFHFFYPDFKAWLDDPRTIADDGTARADNDDIQIYLIAGDNNASTGMEKLQVVRGGTTTDKIKPGPYQLLEVRQKDNPTWAGEYIGLFDGTAIDISCGDPNILQDDGTRDNLCIGFYPYKDLDIEESFSVPNLQHWQAIVHKTINFLDMHEVK